MKSIENVLPEEIDVNRTKFFDPKPPTSEVKKQLRWKGGQGGRMNKTR